MNDNKIQNRILTIEAIIAFGICLVIGFFYVQSTMPYDDFVFSMLGIVVLAVFCIAFGGQIAQDKEKSVILYSLIIFVVCLAGFHFFLFLPNS